MSATEPPREAQHGWSQNTHSVRELTRELRAVVRHERLCDDVREMLLSNLAMLNKLRQLPCTRAMLRTMDLKRYTSDMALRTHRVVRAFVLVKMESHADTSLPFAV